MNPDKLLTALRELRRELDSVPTPEQRERMKNEILAAISKLL